MALLLAVVAAALLLVNRPKPAIYAGFGITVPSNAGLIGIDVSRYQGRIFWDAAAQMQDQGYRLRFAFIKATDGTALADPRFERNLNGATEAGLCAGAYHYFHPAQSAVAQARHFLKTAAPRAGMLRPVLDAELAEGLSPADLRDSLCTWLTLVEGAVHTAPIVYTNAAFYNRYLKGWMDDYPLWIAHYGAAMPGIKTDYQFWQFSDRGRVNGIRVPVDFNACPGDSAALQAMLLP